MNISKTKDCYGCGVCATVCPKGIINIVLNENGFYEPRIDSPNKCIDCGLCIKVCSFSDFSLAAPHSAIKCYAAWSLDPKTRHMCSSGGAAIEIERNLMEEGYKVCCVKYDVSKQCATHYISTKPEDLKASVGSKYIQSYTVDGFKSIGKKGKWLVTGTPCQIDSFRRYIKLFNIEDNFILMDFFCHGVPSMFLFKKYLKEKTHGWEKITDVSWRDKRTGWHDSYVMSLTGETTYNFNTGMPNKTQCTKIKKKLSEGDEFFRLFLSDQCLGKACYERCKFKNESSSADIRIGDFWGNAFANNENGVSAIAVFTEKGAQAVIQSNCKLTPFPFEIISEGQMKVPPKRDWRYTKLNSMLRDNSTTLKDMIIILDRHDLMRHLTFPFRHPLKTISNIIVKRTLRIKKK